MQGRSGLVLIALVVAAGALFAILSGRTPDPIAAGQPAPAFALPSLSSDAPVSLDSLRGRIVLLNFWATWCKPCEEEMPAMERLHRTLAGKPFELVAVSVDEDRAVVEAYRARLGLSFPILLDPSKSVAHSYQTYRYPESFLIGADGKVVARFVGPREWDAGAYVDRIRELVDSVSAPRG
jgi:thiol-disulfide isomerase/thioredoxin